MRLARTLISIVLVAAFVGGTVSTASAGSLPRRAKALRDDMFQLVNSSRRHHGVRPLNLCWAVSKDAWEHSKHMAARHSVYHTTDLWSVVRRYDPSIYGENVAMGGTLKRVERMFMGSAPHRANILNGRFRHIGVGAVRSGGRLWVTLDFYGG
jgi:uncharacterized protein YkwD